ncbi:MAG: ABC transporter permease [Actinobacteria bacterium]|nr:ABC transporter permease [Actinomycetota bacterium]MBB38373.1 ABC transporter permease [Actinomycetota bacterium]MBB38436.1 ABC transporter permease [Actinomycetota bacterium]|tara:strand:- start:2724 stop:3647 length:924 start_codon:yes stop_codon:yes gene_type:complete
MVDIQLMGLLNATLQAATLLFVAALGELITEKSGILNLGVEGMISVGAVAGFITAINTENLILSIFVGILSASIFSSIHAFVTVILKQDQTVSGLILTILGLALSALLGKNYVGKKLNVKIESIGNISEPTNVLEVLLNQNIIFYIAIVVMLTTAYVLKNTMFGRRFQAVGEDSKSSDSMGLNIVKTQFIATCVGGAFAGLAGVYLTLSYVPYWTDGMTSGRGWIALALVIFGGWKPYRTAFGAIIFGFLEALVPRLQTYGFELSPYLLRITPYLITIIVLVVLTIYKEGETGAPGNIGRPFFRENR